MKVHHVIWLAFLLCLTGCDIFSWDLDKREIINFQKTLPFDPKDTTLHICAFQGTQSDYQLICSSELGFERLSLDEFGNETIRMGLPGIGKRAMWTNLDSDTLLCLTSKDSSVLYSYSQGGLNRRANLTENLFTSMRIGLIKNIIVGDMIATCDSTGHLILTGSITQSIGGIQLFAARMVSNGKVIWANLYNPNMQGLDIKCTEDGIYITGSLNNNGFVSRLTADGTMLWIKKVWDIEVRGHNEMALINDHVLITGQDIPSQKMRIMAYDQFTGDLAWAKLYGEEGGRLSQIQTTRDDEIVALGFNSITQMVAFFKIGTTGDLRWDRNYPADLFEYPVEIIQARDHGFALMMLSGSQPWTYDKIRIIKTDEEGITR